jgi:sulfatase maturation enzyme AslB (radical SAM superfamily)
MNEMNEMKFHSQDKNHRNPSRGCNWLRIDMNGCRQKSLAWSEIEQKKKSREQEKYYQKGDQAADWRNSLGLELIQ